MEEFLLVKIKTENQSRMGGPEAGGPGGGAEEPTGGEKVQHEHLESLCLI